MPEPTKQPVGAGRSAVAAGYEEAGYEEAGHVGAGLRPAPSDPGLQTRPSPSSHACPVLDDQAEVVALSDDLGKALRKLTRDLKNCPACSLYEACPLLAELNQTIDAAIRQVTTEFNITKPDCV